MCTPKMKYPLPITFILLAMPFFALSAIDHVGAHPTYKELTPTTMASNTTNNYHTWCNKTTHESLCLSMVQSDPRKDLKSSPQGLVVILVTAAQAKAKATRLFISNSLHNHTTDYKSKAVFEGCLVAFSKDWINNQLKVSMQRVSDKHRCVDLYDSLRLVMLEVAYDCDQNPSSPISPSLSQMYKNVESLVSIIEVAQQILSFIGCGTI